MLENDFAPIWAVSIGIVVPLVAVLGVCICGCKKTVPKTDLHGLPGMVKITNPDDASNHQLTIEMRGNNAANHAAASTEACDMSRRSSATVNRSLPAIPSGGGGVRGAGAEALWESEANGDTGSELYATVGDKNLDRQASEPLVSLEDGPSKKRAPAPGAVGAAAAGAAAGVAGAGGSEGGGVATPGHSDDSVHYDCLKSEHPYDRVKKSEHPYAQVQASSGASSGTAQGPSAAQSSSNGSDGGEAAGVASMARSSEGDTSNPNPVPPPRSRRSTGARPGAGVGAAAAEASGAVGAAGAGEEEGIAAATAIAGRVAASQELPYMTPPLPAPPPPPPPAHFSGDSQDSKGYTSISVREPLASIKAQTKGFNQNPSSEMQDSHYATVSDDSDEMYAAIEDPVQLYNSGSETYAQIQPSGVVEASVYPPQPPSVDSLKHVAHAHSRQASSSSASSSVANLGSPKPEKRQANSPLPPPPFGSPEKAADKLNAPSAGEVMNLEEMYAKVMKKKHTAEANAAAAALKEQEGASLPLYGIETPKSSTSGQEGVSTDINSQRLSVSDSTLKSDCFNTDQARTEGHVRMQEKNVLQTMNSDSQLQATNSSECQQDADPGYEVVLARRASEKSVSTSETKVGQMRCEDESYSSPSDSNASNNNSSESNSTYSLRRVTNDSNNNSNTEDSIYPKYESVLPVGFTSDGGRNDSPFFSDEISEPNYESMPSEETELNYSGVAGASGSSELDPNYEVVEHDDPNYESVSYMETNSDPPYERLHNEVRDFETGADHNYEHARQCNSGTSDGQSKGITKRFTDADHPHSEPGYEEIGHQKNKVWNDLESKGGDELTSVSSM